MSAQLHCTDLANECMHDALMDAGADCPAFHSSLSPQPFTAAFHSSLSQHMLPLPIARAQPLHTHSLAPLHSHPLMGSVPHATRSKPALAPLPARRHQDFRAQRRLYVTLKISVESTLSPTNAPAPANAPAHGSVNGWAQRTCTHHQSYCIFRKAAVDGKS
jgi:hypothetical protein